jgi:hypothetical protein
MNSEEPLDVADVLFRALAEKRWLDAADLVSPRVLTDFEAAVREMERDASDTGPGAWYAGLFGFDSPEQTHGRTGRELMAAHAQHRDPDAQWPQGHGAGRLRRTPLGEIRERPDLVHVVYRAGFYSGSRLLGEDAVAVLTLEGTVFGWRAQKVDFGADLVFMTPSFSTGSVLLEADEPPAD